MSILLAGLVEGCRAEASRRGLRTPYDLGPGYAGLVADLHGRDHVALLLDMLRDLGARLRVFSDGTPIVIVGQLPMLVTSRAFALSTIETCLRLHGFEPHPRAVRCVVAVLRRRAKQSSIEHRYPAAHELSRSGRDDAMGVSP